MARSALLAAALCLGVFAATCHSQVCQCPPTPQFGSGTNSCINDQPLPLGSPQTGNGPVQHVLVLDYAAESSSYSARLARIATYLEREVKLLNPAGTVTFRQIFKNDPCDLVAKLGTSLSAFTQIWVTDLENGTPEGSNKHTGPCQFRTVAELIGAWYTGQQEIIVDGRVLSSVWTTNVEPPVSYLDSSGTRRTYTWGTNSLEGINPIPNPADYATSTWPWAGCPSCDNGPLFTSSTNDPPRRTGNANLFINFFHHGVRAGNGLLYLGTDHNSYVGGINMINDEIGLGRFRDNFNEAPWAALADPASGIFHWPTVASHHPLDLDQTDGDNCPTRFIWDDSSTSYTPFNLQNNGRVLNTIAWHGTDIDKPAIATTLPSGVGFVINIDTPLACPITVTQGDALDLNAAVLQNPSGSVASWIWELISVDGVGSEVLCSTQSCSPAAAIPLSFPGGAAQIRVRATNGFGEVATDYLCITLPRTPCQLPVPAIPDAVFSECTATTGTVPDGTYCALSCDGGATLEVWEPPHCDNGNWVGGASCVPVRCHTRPPVSNADVVALETCNELATGESCPLTNVVCNPGHTRQGPAPTCTLDGGAGVWTNLPVCVPNQCNQGFFLNANQACEACAPGTFKTGTGTPSSCTLCPANTFNSLSGAAACQACLPGTTSDAGASECSICPIDWRHDWLETRYEPVLDDTVSGFNKYSRGPNWVSVVFDNPNKYEFQSASIFSTAEQMLNRGMPIDDVSASAPLPLGDYTADRGCYTRYEMFSLWGDLEPSCARDDTSSTQWVIYTCKLHVHNIEQLDAIRSTDLTREIFSEMPFQVRFPKQVSAAVYGLSAFQPPNVLAAIVRQEVRVNVNDLSGDLTAEIDLYTSAQWPFKLSAPSVVQTPTDIGSFSFALKALPSGDCVDADAGDQPNPTVDDANACGQTWLLDLDVGAGAAGEPCELDGDYEVAFEAVCQPSFEALTDCPLVKDDQGQIANDFRVQFKIDSEYFCPTLVETVDLSASLKVYKDHAHSVPATNFVLGQTAYFVLETSSNKVNIASTHLNSVSIQLTGGPLVQAFSVGLAGAVSCQAAPDQGATGNVNGFVAEDGDCETGVKTQAFFNFLVDATAVPNIPADGSLDFSVSAVVDVVFKDAGALLEKRSVQLMQQSSASSTVRTPGQAQAASTSFQIGQRDSAVAGASGALAAGAGAAAATLAAAGAL